MASIQFYKYQSLGNDFILLTAASFPNSTITYFQSDVFKQCVITWCQRHTGIGADGLLLFFEGAEPEVIIFNADGLPGQFSGNGSRCAAQYFFMQHIVDTTVQLKMGGRVLRATINRVTGELAMEVALGKYEGAHQIQMSEQQFIGDFCDVGNPHVLIERTGSGNDVEDFLTFKTELSRVGYDLVVHQGINQQRNVHWYWKKQQANEYWLIPFERGAGMTKACSSGALALAWVLYCKKHLTVMQPLTIYMEGGVVTVCILTSEKMLIQAKAQMVFSGVCEI